MPDPREGESREDFLGRCIPMVLEDGAAEDQEQAVAMCVSLFGEQEPPETCVCPECGAEQDKARGVPCRSLECPECGAMMVAKTEGEQMEDNQTATTEAEVEIVTEAVTKTVDGEARPASDFLMVEDPEKPSTWHLPVKREGKPDHRLMGAAKAALTDPRGFRGNKYAGPDKAGALKKLKALYKSEDLEWEEAALDKLRQAWEILTEVLNMEEEDQVAELTESATGHVIGIAEGEGAIGGVVPLHLDVAIIQPGWGNKRDNHYYPRDVLRRDAAVFEGVKMFESDHRQEEKSTRTWVSTITGISGFTDDGAPVGRVSVHDRNFAERLLALDADGLLGRMECSILAGGKAKRGEVEGRKAKIVEAITSADSVDWVTRAGAGGRALSLAESGGEPMEQEQEQVVDNTQPEPLEEVTLQEQQPEDQPAPLDAERVREIVGATNLPGASKARLAEAQYADEQAVEAAVRAEVAYVKEITGSGKPSGLGGSQRQEPLTEEEKRERFNRHLAEVGMRPV